MKTYIDELTDIPSDGVVADGCMVTYSGIVFNLLEPREEDIDLRDIAHHLAMCCRWNGGTKRFYSVAEHCVRLFEQCEDINVKAAMLFHDAEEAYWGDIIRPIKKLLPVEFRERMKLLRKMIFTKFGVPEIEEAVMNNLDYNMLLFEKENLILSKGVRTMPPDTAESEFITRCDYLLNTGIIHF